MLNKNQIEKCRQLANEAIQRGIKTPTSLKSFLLEKKQAGFAISGVMGLMIAFMVLGYLAVAIWPQIVIVSGNVSTITGTDTGTVVLKAFWVVATMVVGIAVGYAAIRGAMNEMQL